MLLRERGRERAAKNGGVVVGGGRFVSPLPKRCHSVSSPSTIISFQRRTDCASASEGKPAARARPSRLSACLTHSLIRGLAKISRWTLLVLSQPEPEM